MASCSRPPRSTARDPWGAELRGVGPEAVGADGDGAAPLEPADLANGDQAGEEQLDLVGAGDLEVAMLTAMSAIGFPF